MRYDVERMTKRKKEMNRNNNEQVHRWLRTQQIDPWPFVSKLVYDKHDEQESAAKQQRVDQSGVEPIEPVALVESSIEQAEARAGIEHSRPVRGPQKHAIHRLGRHAKRTQTSVSGASSAVSQNIHFHDQ